MLYLMIVLGIISTTLISVFTIKDWVQIWIVPVSFVGSMIVIIALYFFIIWIFSIFVSSKKRYGKPSNFYYNMMNGFYKMVCQVSGLKIHVTGKEKVPTDKRVLYVCNHLSMLDPMVHSTIFPERKIAFITKISNYKIPIGGKFARRACYIPIDREDPRKALESIHIAQGLINNDITDIGVYPEGHRGVSYKMEPFKTGVFMIAQKTACPVVVCTIYGLKRGVKKSIFKKMDVYFDILDVLPSNGTPSKELSDKAFEIMQNNLNLRNGDKQ